MLLLYALLHGNDAFRAYVLGDAARLSKVLTPTLRGLYDASKRESYKEKTVSDGDGVGAAGKKSSHDVTYVLLVIVLILTQDDAFGDALSNALIPVGPNWYEERMLRRTPLGSLLVLVLVRTVHRHLAGSEPLRCVPRRLISVHSLSRGERRSSRHIPPWWFLFTLHSVFERSTAATLPEMTEPERRLVSLVPETCTCTRTASRRWRTSLRG